MSPTATEFEFVLPRGYLDEDGRLHRTGVRRLATARDELVALRDRSLSGPEDPLLTILVLARVIVSLGTNGIWHLTLTNVAVTTEAGGERYS